MLREKDIEREGHWGRTSLRGEDWEKKTLKKRDIEKWG